MGEVRSISDNGFTGTGGEGGVVRGVRLRNAALARRMPWGDNWQWIRIGMMVSVETFGITRNQPGFAFSVGTCSGPWSIGDHASRTFRATGVQIYNSGQTNTNCFSWHDSWTVTTQGGRNTWNNNGGGRGVIYNASSSGGSYANGGNGRVNLTYNNTTTIAAAGGVAGIPDTTGSPSRRTALIFDIQRQPYLTNWNFRWICTTFNNSLLGSDITLKGYLSALGNDVTANSTDGWYSTASPTITNLTAFAGSTIDTRNAPMDYADLYWESYVMGLNLWRYDIKKLA